MMEEELDFKIQRAFCIVRNIFISDKIAYEALVGSIESALRENVVWEELEYTETAKKIANRVIGND